MHSVSMRYYYRLSLLLIGIFLLPSSTLFPQINRQDQPGPEETMRNPWKSDRSEFVKEWLILGPIPATSLDDLDKDFLSEYRGEAGIEPSNGDTESIIGSPYPWRAAKCKDFVDLQALYHGARTEDAVAYAWATINRKTAGKFYLLLGSDDAVKVWFNGTMVHRAAAYRPFLMDEDVFAVDADAGENHLLLKILQGKGGWGFAVRMRDNLNQLDIITGNIEFTFGKADPATGTITLVPHGTIDTTLLKQPIKMDVMGTGGRIVASRPFQCPTPVDVTYKDWPDGPYEFRFIYKDLHGMQSIKYLPWYKGDILAAARALVGSAPGENVRTPEGSLHRMLADMILDRLDNDLGSSDSSKLNSLIAPLAEFAEITTHSQIRPGGMIRLVYIDDIDNTPQFCRAYLPLNYDPSKKWPMIVYLHGMYGANPEIYNWPGAQQRHKEQSDRYDVIFIEPHGRGTTQYLGIGDRDVLKCIEMAKEKFSVDEDRVYLTGSSMGGFGTWNVATRHPQLFAAIAPIYGGGDYHVNAPKEQLEAMPPWEKFLADKSSSTTQLEALLNIPVLVIHGDHDQIVDVDASRYLVRMLERWNYDVRYLEVPGKGHEELGLWDTIVPWLLDRRRNPAPRRVRVRSAVLRNASAYWVEVNRRINPSEFIVVDAEVLDNNIIRVDSKNATGVVLSPDSCLIDASKPVTVVWNGDALRMSVAADGKLVLDDGAGMRSAGSKTPRLAGPISDVTNTPFMIVIGTTSPDLTMRTIIEQKAEIMAQVWKFQQKHEPRIKKDVNVSEEDMRRYSLVLLGGPKENFISKILSEKLPFRVNPDEIVVDGRSFAAGDAVLRAVTPNPCTDGAGKVERYVDFIAATSAKGFGNFKPLGKDDVQFDFYIDDGTLPNYSAGVPRENSFVAAGFFDSDWKIDASSITGGDPALRSKCARAVMQEDLSMKITGGQPSLDKARKSYCGYYDPVGTGPGYTIFIENSELKALQQGSSRPFTAVPVSESEYYIKEFDLSLSFMKSGAAEKMTMIIHQGSQEFVYYKTP